MASLNVDWSEGTYKSGSYNIVVKIEPYKRFKLFQRIRFRDRDGLPLVDFSITNNSKTIRYDYHSKSHFSVDHIEYVDVFVCRCSKNNPVLIGVNHAGKQKYYGVSKLHIGTDLHILSGRNNISDDELQEFLIQENDKINNTITFRIEKKNRYKNIQVKEDDSLDGFTKYTHEPNRGFATHKSILLRERTRITLRDNPINGQALGAARISVYFRQSGKHNDVPLMLGIHRNGKNHYFSRKNLHETTWKKIEIDSDSEISERLEQIEKELFHSILVLLHKKVPYKKNHLEHVKNSKPAKIIKGEIVVTSNKCSTFNNSNYIRFEHDLSSYNDGKENYHSFGSFNFRIVSAYIFNVAIETYNENEVEYIYYQGGSSKLSVWFFKCDPDIETFPLIINYGNSWFKPKSREEYFTKWVKLTKLKSSINLCQSGHDDILKELKCVNRMLNQIELGHKVDEKNKCEYGIPRPYDLDESYDTNTINLKCGPFKTDDFYLECTHTPKNGFSIGKTCYKEKTSGQYSKNHIKQTERSCYLDVEANSAKEYYFKFDTNKEHPLLVEYELNDKTYNYYILQFDDFKFAEYKPKILSSENKIDDINLITILNHQNFVLNNVIKIELDKRTSYSCCNELKHKEYVNFVCIADVLDKCCNLNNKSVNVRERVQLVKLSPENCLQPSYGYIGYKHGLESYILSSTKKEKSNKRSNSIKIKGFKIGDHELTLDGSGLVKGNIINAQNIYVYFYGDDPRPLMLCFNKKAYAPKDMLYYFMRWEEVTEISNCACKGTQGDNGNELLEELSRVSNFLNPVKLYQTGWKYVIQNFNGQKIRIQVEKTPAKGNFCYNRYIHSPEKAGFRLGDIKYDTDCIKESTGGKKGNCITSTLDDNKKPNNYKSADQVVVFYYKHDTDHKFPMVVAMGTNSGNGQTNCKLYYILVDKVNKIYEKKEEKEEFNLDNDNEVTKKLDDALFGTSNKLQIILDRRSMEKLYCKNSKGVNESGDFDQPYLCYTLAGTFSSLLIIGTSTLLICKHFMKFKMKDMIPRF